MSRCIALAKLGAGFTAPNPMVGAVLVYNDRIIGEGYHKIYGGPHAEVNCIASIKQEDEMLVMESVMYVSLEPCAHFGKTPPCADLIIKKQIPKVVIGCRDPFIEVDGKGMEKLKAAGVEIQYGILEQECISLNKRFFLFHELHRPFVVLKWAQSLDGKLAGLGDTRTLISNELTNRLVHRWRSEEAAILVGTNTALKDNPSLDNRLWKGAEPVRLVIDRYLDLPESLKLFNREKRTVVFNTIKHEETPNLLYYRLNDEASLIKQVVDALYELQIQSVLVEGGLELLQSFIDEGIWDEARVIENGSMIIGEGITAPVLKNQQWLFAENSCADKIDYYKKTSSL